MNWSLQLGRSWLKRVTCAPSVSVFSSLSPTVSSASRSCSISPVSVRSAEYRSVGWPLLRNSRRRLSHVESSPRNYRSATIKVRRSAQSTHHRTVGAPWKNTFSRGGPMHNRLAISISVILLLITIACSKRPNDEQIQKDIQTKVAADPDTRDAAITVESKDGKVTLTGKVATPVAQQKLEQIAKDEPGATGVDDQTAVDPQAMESQPMANQPMASQPMASQPAPPPVEVPKPQPIVVPAGTALTIKLGQALGSKTSQSSQTSLATLAQPVSVQGKSALPAGSTASGTVVSAKAKGKLKGEG